jgi:hypothetical protein
MRRVTCITLCWSFEEMYSSAGIREGVIVSESKLNSGESGGEIMSLVRVLGELGT